MTNATCHNVIAPDGPPLFQNGNLVFQGTLALESTNITLIIISFCVQHIMYGRALIISLTATYTSCQVGWIVSGFFAIVATVVSFWLVNKHLQWYTNVRMPVVILVPELMC